MQEVLREAGYVASNSEKYPLQGIVSAIENAFHATPQLVCSGDAVEELRLCFYKDFKVRPFRFFNLYHAFLLHISLSLQIRDCAVGSNTSEGSCPIYVSLPESISSLG